MPLDSFFRKTPYRGSRIEVWPSSLLISSIGYAVTWAKRYHSTQTQWAENVTRHPSLVRDALPGEHVENVQPLCSLADGNGLSFLLVQFRVEVISPPLH